MINRTKRPVSAYLRNDSEIPGGGTMNITGVEISGDDLAIVARDWTVADLTQKIRVDVFRECPSLVEPCANFLYDATINRRPATRLNYIKFLRYLSRYMTAYGSSYGVRICEYSDFSTTMMKGFHPWLRDESAVRPKVNENGGLGKITSSNIHNLIRTFLRWVKESEDYGHLMPQDLQFNSNVSDNGHHDIKHRKGLPEAVLAAVRRACFDDLDETLERLKIGSKIISDPTIEIPQLSLPSVTPFRAFEVCVKSYQATESIDLSTSEFHKKFPGLTRAMRAPYHDFSEILRHLHFTKRSIVPVVLLLGMHLAFEPDTLLHLDWNREDDSFLFGDARGVIAGEKFRGGYSTPTKSFSRSRKEKYSSGALIEILRDVTKNTAKHISPSCQKIFAFVRRDGTYGYFSQSTSFQKSLNTFIKEHNLPHFSLSALRKTGGDLIGKLTGGDIAEQKAYLKQKAVETTIKSYQSDANISRRAEQLAHSHNVRARRVMTGGKIETRGAGLHNGQRLAATFGFYCLEPYDSPQPGQIKGQLCQAYGSCPDCPLAQIDKSSGHDCCRVMQVREKLLEARRAVDPSRWAKYWARQLAALELQWLPTFLPSAREEAAMLSLPAIPGFE